MLGDVTLLHGQVFSSCSLLWISDVVEGRPQNPAFGDTADWRISDSRGADDDKKITVKELQNELDRREKADENKKLTCTAKVPGPVNSGSWREQSVHSLTIEITVSSCYGSILGVRRAFTDGAVNLRVAV